MKATPTQGLVAKNLMPYMGIQFDRLVEFSTLQGVRRFRVFTYQAYNANGLIGSEVNGICIADDDKRRVVCDGIAKQDSGYFGASQAQFDEAERICAMDWPTFMAFVNAHPNVRDALLDAAPKPFRFRTPPMADGQFMTAARKKAVLKDWVAFLNGGFRFEDFTKALYDHLTLSCSFIAHFNRLGFYETYFKDARQTARFLSQFDRTKGCVSVEYGDCHWIHKQGYEDLNGAMVSCIVRLLPDVKRRLASKEVEAAKASFDQARARLERAGGEVA